MEFIGIFHLGFPPYFIYTSDFSDYLIGIIGSLATGLDSIELKMAVFTYNVTGYKKQSFTLPGKAVLIASAYSSGRIYSSYGVVWIPGLGYWYSGSASSTVMNFFEKTTLTEWTPRSSDSYPRYYALSDDKKTLTYQEYLRTGDDPVYLTVIYSTT